MNLKEILKRIKEHESSISTVLGFVVIVIVGLLIVNYFRNVNDENQVDIIADVETQTTDTTHTIGEGESLWTIAENYYNDGFRWTDIMEANNIDNPADIEVGQEITIPNVEENGDAMAMEKETEEVLAMETATPEAEVTAAPVATEEPVEVVEESNNDEEVIAETNEDTQVYEGDTYTVVRGDNLWDIAVAVYGDGYRWTDIANANDLVHPGIIHAGNVLVLPQ